MKTKYFALVIIVFASFYFSCSKDATPPNPTTTYLDLPATPYSYPVNSGGMLFNNNVGTLGRVLFYDSHLSVNNSISCATCHNQARAFSDNVNFSRGFENILTGRNAPPINNVSEFAPLFWDGREQFLNTMVLAPVVNHVEMGMSDINSIVSKLQALPYYNDLFIKAYGSSTVTSQNISQALAVFVENIRSDKTKFDNFLNGQATLSGVEMQGKSLFFGKYNCNVCHQTDMPAPVGYGTPTGTTVRFVNIGLDANTTDNGRGNVTHDAADNGKFKIPSLKNVTLTAPYMHDGRFSTLEQVLDHYSHGIANHPNLDPKLKSVDGSPLQMNISNEEKTAIIAFLNTLTDYSMITDIRFSNPFKTH